MTTIERRARTKKHLVNIGIPSTVIIGLLTSLTTYFTNLNSSAQVERDSMRMKLYSMHVSDSIKELRIGLLEKKIEILTDKTDERIDKLDARQSRLWTKLNGRK